MALTDTLGVVGTWVAVLLALVALVGIIGPVLIWRASRSLRHVAIVEIGDEEHKYISPGIHIWSNIYLFQQVRVPILDNEVIFEAKNFTFQADEFHLYKSKVAWVKFGGLLDAYKFKFTLDDHLVLHRGMMLLPIHKRWILGLGILGRYSDRQEDARVSRQKQVLTFRLPTTAQAGGSNRRHWRDDTRDIRERIERRNEDNHSDGESRSDVALSESPESRRMLVGTTGSFRFTKFTLQPSLKGPDTPGTPQTLISFTGLAPQEIGTIQAEVISLKDMAMLAVGCLPSAYSDQFLGLTDISEEPNSGVSRSYREVEHERLGSRITARIEERDTRIRIARRGSDGYGLEAYEYMEINLEGNQVEDIFHAFQASNVTILNFTKIEYTMSLVAELEIYAGSTFVPASSPWIRLDDGGVRHELDIYLRRKDAQRFAHALLTLRWHPESYLIGYDRKTSVSMSLVKLAADQFVQLKNRVFNGIDHLDLTPDNKKDLTKALQFLQGRGDKIVASRALFKELFLLDEALEALKHQNGQITHMIGILMITNREFANLLTDSARHLNDIDRVRAKAEINPYNGTVKVPSGFGMMQSFVVDMDYIYPDNEGRDQQGFLVDYPVLLLSCLKACLRCTMLHNCFDSAPLLDSIVDIKKEVYMN